MKRLLLSVIVCVAFLMVTAPRSLGQADQPIRLPAGTTLHVLHARPSSASLAATTGSTNAGSTNSTSTPAQAVASSGATLPLWKYKITSPVDGVKYTGQMVGRSPFHHPDSFTVVPAVLIPVKLRFVYQNGGALEFDPTAGDAACIGPGNTGLGLTQQSPLFHFTDFNFGGTDVGLTQYLDAFQRANFWQNVSGSRYHVLLAPVTLPAITVQVPSASTGSPDGAVYQVPGQCGSGLLGVMNIDYWDTIAQSVLSRFHLSAGHLTVFVLYDSVMSVGNPTDLSNCCVLGYHNAIGSPMRTYAVADFEGRVSSLFAAPGILDIAPLSHEMAEWLDDPSGVNPTPAWGNIGQVAGCQNNLEVGDPLTGTDIPPVTMPNGFTYHLQELAFFSWFFRQRPSIGVNGWYSDNGTFTTDAGPVCATPAPAGSTPGGISTH